MAERKAGPVKPPVIEGVARETPPKPAAAGPDTSVPAPAKAEAKPETKLDPVPRPAATKPEPPPAAATARPEAPRPSPPPPPPPPPPRQRPLIPEPPTDWRLMGSVALAGAVLGTVLTYVLGNVIALPSRTLPIADPAPQLLAQEERTDALEQRLSGLETGASATQSGIDAAVARLDDNIAELRQGIDAVKTAIPKPVTIDLGPIQADLRTLRSRIDALAAGVSGDDAGAIAQSLEAIRSNVAALGGRLDAVDAVAAALRTDLEAARKLLNDHITSALPSEVGPALKLPLILSGLETAFASGRAFSLELDALATVLPDIEVTARLKDAAPGGLLRPDALQLKFETLLPEILAARAGSKGNWAEDALDWLKSLLALRPAEETEGATPDAIVSRLEGAMQRRDYRQAAELVASLPPEMREAAAVLVDDIASHADADALLAQLRARALTGTEPAP
ncbi:MAG: hypothetical protein ABIO40_01640 [Devosia sp.]